MSKLTAILRTDRKKQRYYIGGRTGEDLSVAARCGAFDYREEIEKGYWWERQKILLLHTDRKPQALRANVVC